jgi:S-DNA-T family DNA segregation ATPase FtsK/SpoIIIE
MLKSKIKSTMASKETKKELIRHTFPSDLPTYSSLEVLQTAKDKNTHIDESFLITKVKNLQSKLAEFNVPVEVEGFDVGPSVIQIRVRPQAGIKVSAIENLQNDVALSLKAKALRIVAPIPGTDCIGIQLPNPKPQMVKLADMLNSPVFLERMNDNYTNLSLGKNVAGQEVIKSLEDMPHLLIAGATGSGKSVGVNDFILALMYQNTPSDLKFLMIDPKQVEMELYAGLPYLLAPIVTESDKALRLLKWSVDEMESRYTMLKHAKVKHMSEYNEKYPDQTMYRIVIIIDELADLMMSGNKKEVELCITRIAQKARAVGIHLIVATQRPSVNVITGLIKANLPTRIAFSVVSQIDSRTILGTKGAEELVGKGDLLYMDPSTKYPERVQAPFVTTKEINRTVRYLKTKYMKNISEADMYHPELMAVLDGTATVAVDI